MKQQYRFGGAWGYRTNNPGDGLVQLGARWYWPEIGRFIQQDPIAHGMNWYAYAGNNPLVYIDPFGLCWTGLDTLQLGLDALGLIPGFGEAFDIINAGISAGRGDWAGAGWNAVSAIPFVGYLGIVGKGAKYADKAGDLAKALNKGSKLARAEAKAARRYPKLVARGTHMHHLDPIYLGGAPTGKTVPVKAPLHQVIHNEIYQRFPRGIGDVPDDVKWPVLNRIYRNYGLM